MTFPHATSGPPGPFAALRGRPGDRGAAEPCTFIAVAEVERFLPLRRRLGLAVAVEIMSALTARVTRLLAGAMIGRVGRTSVEFAFQADDLSAAAGALDRLQRAMEERIDIEGLRFGLSVVIGAVHLADGAVPDACVDIAAAAVLDAQREHQRVRIVGEAQEPTAGIDEWMLLRDLPGAMRSGALELHYQPKLSARTGTIGSAEALLRWEHPQIGPVPIESLVRLVEETGAIRALTEWGIERAIADQAALRAAGHDLTLYVNLSGLLLPDAAFTARVLELVAGAEGRIGFEITETAVIGDPERAIANLESLAAAGVRIAIDDYGSGLSSLAYLKQLPAHELKIDRMFIKELTASQRDPLLVRSSIDLAHALEMEVTAEGVDDPLALALLKIMGCDMMQGYLISHALPLPALTRWLDDAGQLARLHAPAMPTAWAATAR